MDGSMNTTLPGSSDDYYPDLASDHPFVYTILTFFTFSGDPITKENWSTFIGIITAIVGNILISFALNTQRYAHIKLNQESEDEERRRKEQEIENYGLDGAEDGHQSVVHSDGTARRRSTTSRRTSLPSTGTAAARRTGVSLHHSSVPSDIGSEEHSPLIETEERHGVASIYRHSTESAAAAAASAAATGHRDSTDTDSTYPPKGQAEADAKKSYLRSPYWWIGIILMTIGEGGNFLAYGFAPASIVSPLGVVALISNCIIAPVLLKEPFRKRDLFGVVISVGGAVTIVSSASDHNPKLGPDEIWNLIATWEFETYLGFTLFMIVGLMAASKKYGEKSIFIDLGLVGLFGAYTVLSTKGVASLLSYTLWRAITFPIFYLLVFVLVGTAILQIKYVNRGLQRFDATQVIPTQFVLFTLSVILGSAVLYRDFEKTNSDEAGKFIFGCALTFLGVWLITTKRARNSDEDDMAPEAPDSINLFDGERYRDEADTHFRSGPYPNDISSERRHRSDDGVIAGWQQQQPHHLPASPPISAPNTPPLRPQTDAPNTPTITLTRSGTQTSTASITANNSPLAKTPWTEDSTAAALAAVTSSPPPLAAAVSTPVLPSELSEPTRPRTPRGSSDFTSAAVLATPANHSANLPYTPATIDRAQETQRPAGRNNSITAGSISGLAGPLLASPLSSSLTAVVAELRRNNTPRGSIGAASRRRRGTGDLESGLAAVETGGAATTPSTPYGLNRDGRGRSWSASLSDLLSFGNPSGAVGGTGSGSLRRSTEAKSEADSNGITNRTLQTRSADDLAVREDNNTCSTLVDDEEDDHPHHDINDSHSHIPARLSSHSSSREEEGKGTTGDNA